MIDLAPGAAELLVAGGIEHQTRSSGAGTVTCHLCGEWTDADSAAAFKLWARTHARTAHDAMRPAVLGLDLSLTRAGIVVSTVSPHNPGGGAWPALVTNVGRAGSQSDGYAERNLRIVEQVHAVVRIIDEARRAGADIRLAVTEGPIYFGQIMPSYYDRAALWWSVYSALAHRGIPIAVVTPDHRAKFICGVKPPSGDKAKRLVLDESRARYRNLKGGVTYADPTRMIANHDQADALGLADMGVLHLGWPTPWRPARRHVENVALVTWPEVIE